MVIPTDAKRTGITVRLVYVAAAVLFVSFGLSLFASPRASALLPISSLPIVGQPVADVANTALGGVVQPTVDTVAGALPQPIGNTVRTPTNLVAQVATPIIGPSAPNNPAQQIVATVLPQTASVNPPVATTPASSSATPQNSPAKTSQQTTPQAAATSDEAKLPLLAGTALAFLDSFLPPFQGIMKNFPVGNGDPSVVIAVVVTLLLMALVLARLIVIITRYTNSNSGAIAMNEAAMTRRDLTQASAVMLGLFAIGLVVVIALCLN